MALHIKKSHSAMLLVAENMSSVFVGNGSQRLR